eukprot:s3189_g14.t1
MPPRPAVYFDDARSGGPHEIVGMLPITFTNGEVEDWWRRLIGAICVTGSLSGERGCFAWNTLRITSPSHSCGCSSVDRGDCGLVVYPHSIYLLASKARQSHCRPMADAHADCAHCGCGFGPAHDFVAQSAWPEGPWR